MQRHRKTRCAGKDKPFSRTHNFLTKDTRYMIGWGREGRVVCGQGGLVGLRSSLGRGRCPCGPLGGKRRVRRRPPPLPGGGGRFFFPHLFPRASAAFFFSERHWSSIGAAVELRWSSIGKALVEQRSRPLLPPLPRCPRQCCPVGWPHPLFYNLWVGRPPSHPAPAPPGDCPLGRKEETTGPAGAGCLERGGPAGVASHQGGASARGSGDSRSGEGGAWFFHSGTGTPGALPAPPRGQRSTPHSMLQRGGGRSRSGPAARRHGPLGRREGLRRGGAWAVVDAGAQTCGGTTQGWQRGCAGLCRGGGARRACGARLLLGKQDLLGSRMWPEKEMTLVGEPIFFSGESLTPELLLCRGTQGRPGVPQGHNRLGIHPGRPGDAQRGAT